MLRDILGHPLVYNLWQGPFFRQKMEPVIKYGNLPTVQRVLDVGCGPGTNAEFFSHCEYLGIDFNEAYIKYAREHHKGRFEVLDVRTYTPSQENRYDLILLNSLLHHLSEPETTGILSKLPGLLSPGGHVHIVDLVIPDRQSPARWLAKLDRGEFPRTLEVWRELFSRNFAIFNFEQFPIRRFGIDFWALVYCKAGIKT